MAEAVYNASGLGLPIVMTIGNRAIGAPINIWNDQQDSMSMRDAGWIQLYAETNQEAVDLHIQAFRLAEELSVPVMVCMDGFILTHAYERVDVPSQGHVDRFLPAFSPRQILDPEQPVTIGAMVGPEAFTEVRYLAHYRQMQALWMIPELAEEFEQQFGRASGGLIHTYHSQDAETLVVALGSVNGTIKDVVDEMRQAGNSIGSVSICSFRPFPMKALNQAMQHASRVVVIEKSLAVGIGGIVSTDVRMALAGLGIPVHTVVAGLGGRAITRASLREVFEKAGKGALQRLTFLDMNHEVIDREIERLESTRMSGPTAENILRDLGTVADRIG
jgi:pyruvate ferredoxin oxidoreductase alpha subunit